MNDLTVKEFASLLCENCKEGFATDAAMITDGYMPEDVLTRKAAAKITHTFIKEVLKIKDIENINPAEKLRDLYDCRTCVNHIAQVYLRGIMDGVEINGVSENAFLIFDGAGYVSYEEAEIILSRVAALEYTS